MSLRRPDHAFVARRGQLNGVDLKRVDAPHAVRGFACPLVGLSFALPLELRQHRVDRRRRDVGTNFEAMRVAGQRADWRTLWALAFSSFGDDGNLS